LQHTLEKKQSESILLKQKLKILQDVVQRLQKSNKSLLEKLEHLQHEKDGIHVKDTEADVWPPDMQIQLIKDEFEAKEAQWKNALRIGHAKYLKAKEDNKRLVTIIEERDKDIRFYDERAKVDESATNLLQEQIGTKDDLIKDLEKEIGELKESMEMAAAVMGKNETQLNAKDNLVNDLKIEISELKESMEMTATANGKIDAQLVLKDDLIKELENEISKLKESVEMSVAALKENDIQLSAKDNLIKELENEISELKETMEMSAAAMKENEIQLSAKDNLIKELENEISELKKHTEMPAASMGDNERENIVLKEDVLDKVEQLAIAQEKIKVQEEQLSLAKLRLTKLGDRWKNRREELQQIIEQKSQDVSGLRTQLNIMQIEKISLEDSLRRAQQEIDSLRSTVKMNETLADNFHAEEKSWMESVEIASAAVKQAEEREKKLKEELDNALEQNNVAKEDIMTLTKRVQVLKALIEKVETKPNDASEGPEESITLSIDSSVDIELKEDIKKAEVGNLTDTERNHKRLKHDNVFSENGISGDPHRSTKKPRGRLHRLAKRIKSFWRKDKRQDSSN
jgi:Chromosome segregation ATPases